MLDVAERDLLPRLREFLGGVPQTVVIVAKEEILRRVIEKALPLARGRGYIAGTIDLAAVARCYPDGLLVDNGFVAFIREAYSNSKILPGLDCKSVYGWKELPNVGGRLAQKVIKLQELPTLMVVNAIGYNEREHTRLVDVKGRITALTGVPMDDHDQLMLRLLFACTEAPLDIVNVVSEPRSGMWRVT